MYDEKLKEYLKRAVAKIFKVYTLKPCPNYNPGRMYSMVQRKISELHSLGSTSVTLEKLFVLEVPVFTSLISLKITPLNL